MTDIRELFLHFVITQHHYKSIDLIKDYNILDPYIDMVEQQKVDIAEESTITATGIKKETKEQPQQQQPSKSEVIQQQDNAAGVETKDLNE